MRVFQRAPIMEWAMDAVNYGQKTGIAHHRQPINTFGNAMQRSDHGGHVEFEQPGLRLHKGRTCTLRGGIRSSDAARREAKTPRAGKIHQSGRCLHVPAIRCVTGHGVKGLGADAKM